jgi:hypothetical protein
VTQTTGSGHSSDMRSCVLAALCLAGCTAANPLYISGSGGNDGGAHDAGGVGGIGGGGGGGGGAGGDVHDLGVGGGGGGGGGGTSGIADLALPTPDLAHLGECGSWERSCSDLPPTPTSESCVNNTFTADRRCPYGSFTTGASSCSDGYCDPPSGQATACDDHTDGVDAKCNAMVAGTFHYSCQPFVTDGAQGTVSWWCALPYTTATGTAGTKCTDGTQCRSTFCGNNGTCFYGCRSNGDCPKPTRCAAASFVVEGVTVAAHSCVP